ncbi:hypothetical protein OAS37_02270 [Alphaproteobacteria bacterium]|nr:hypothetical protein [Alphaproteobacteria bacterium]
MSGLDWSRILTEYTLEGVGTTFAINFILFTLIGNRFLEFRRLQLLDYIVLSSLFLGFSIFGARQPLFWGMIFLLLTISFLYLPNNFSLFSLARKKFAFKLFSLLILIGIIFTFIVWYRSNRNFELTIYLLDDFNIKLFFDLFLRLLFAETVYTFYNLFAIIENDLAGIISFTDLIYDFMIQFIPAMVFPEKYNAMIIYDLAREYNLAPFGTNYIVGFFALITSSTVGVFFFAFGYCHIIILVIRILFCFCKKKQEAIIIYCLFYTFASAYVVRGSVLGGFKLAVSISIVYLICNFIYTMFRNNKIVFLK